MAAHDGGWSVLTGNVPGRGDKGRWLSYIKGHGEWLVDRQRKRGRQPMRRSEITSDQGTSQGVRTPKRGRKRSQKATAVSGVWGLLVCHQKQERNLES